MTPSEITCALAWLSAICGTLEFTHCGWLDLAAAQAETARYWAEMGSVL